MSHMQTFGTWMSSCHGNMITYWVPLGFKTDNPVTNESVHKNIRFSH